MNTQDFLKLLLLLSPVFLIQLGLAIYALVDLSRRKNIRGKRWAWTLALVLSALALPSGIILSALYLTWGRNIEAQNDTH
jgi:Zn-dependent protease with chaperone function